MVGSSYSHKSNCPPISWWIAVTKRSIANALLQHPDLIKRLGYHHGHFLNWCAKRYCALKPDLLSDILEFETTILTKRFEAINVDLYAKLRLYIFARDNYICHYCDQGGGTLELDHIIPISRGGTNAEDNLATSCFKCNRQKRNKTGAEYLL